MNSVPAERVLSVCAAWRFLCSAWLAGFARHSESLAAVAVAVAPAVVAAVAAVAAVAVVVAVAAADPACPDPVCPGSAALSV